MPVGEPSRFQWIDTPNPKVKGFAIAVPDANLMDTDFASYTISETTWNEMGPVKAAQPVRDSLKNYIWTGSFQSGRHRIFTYVPSMTQEEIETPFLIKSGTRHYDWPTVLYAMPFAVVENDPLTRYYPGKPSERISYTVDRKIARPVIKEGVFASCETREYHYMSPTPFDIKSEPVPAPNRVYWDTDGDSGSLPCLHDKITLPVRGDYWAQINGVPSGVYGGINPYRTFQATEMTDWDTIVVDDNQSQTQSGLWERIRVELDPPLITDLPTP